MGDNISRVICGKGIKLKPIKPRDIKDLKRLADLLKLYKALETTKTHRQEAKTLHRQLLSNKSRVLRRGTELSKFANGIVGKIYVIDREINKTKLLKDAIKQLQGMKIKEYKKAIRKEINQRISTRKAKRKKEEDLRALGKLLVVYEQEEEAAKKILNKRTLFYFGDYLGTSLNKSVKIGIKKVIEVHLGELRKGRIFKAYNVGAAKTSAAFSKILLGAKTKLCFVKPRPRIGPRVVVRPRPKHQPQPKPKKKPLPLRYSLGVIFGYGLSPRQKDKNNPQTLAWLPSELFVQGYGRLDWLIKKNLTLRVNWRGDASFGVEDTKDKIENKNKRLLLSRDFASLSVRAKLKNADLFGLLGYQCYQYDYPSRVTEDRNLGVQMFGVNWRPFPKLPRLSFDLKENLSVGKVNWDSPKDDKFTFRVDGALGASYVFKVKSSADIEVSGGGIGGYNKLRGPVYGGYAKVSFTSKGHKASLEGRYTSVDGLKGILGYSYNRKKWGISAGAFVNYYPEKNLRGLDEDNLEVGGFLSARINPFKFKLFGNPIELRPSVWGAYEPKAKVTKILFGLGIHWDFQPTRPYPLRYVLEEE